MSMMQHYLRGVDQSLTAEEWVQASTITLGWSGSEIEVNHVNKYSYKYNTHSITNIKLIFCSYYRLLTTPRVSVEKQQCTRCGRSSTHVKAN
jgi:hypothetical protein